MFNFIKKGVSASERDREKSDREKDRRKKDKKLRKDVKQNISGNMSTEELLRLDEVRRSLKIRGRRKEKEKLPSGITADYSAEFFAHLNIDRGVERDRGVDEVLADTNHRIDNNGDGEHMLTGNISHSDSSETSQHSTGLHKVRVLPPIPPKPPKRGILKGPRINVVREEAIITTVTTDPTILIKNTLRNEFITYENVRSKPQFDGFDEVNTNLLGMTSASPSAESLTDTTNSSFVTPPFSMSPVGESQSYYTWSRLQAFDDMDLPLPPINLLKLPPPRTLVIHRQKPRNDFGFSLRKAICLDRTESLLLPSLKPVIFAEPGAGGGSTGLLPGDRLIKVNGVSVETLPRETIIEMIKNSVQEVSVEVQPVTELVELSRRCMTTIEENGTDVTDKASNCNTLRRSASKRFQNSSKRHEEASLERYWLIHRGGFCAAAKSSSQSNDGQKIFIQLLHNGAKMSVDEDELEQANPQSSDLVEDICQLKHLNEASVLNCLRQRFGNNLIHTRAGPTLLVVNPMAPLSLYSEKVVSMFRGCKSEDLPPHIYSTAQSAYRAMLESRRDQSLIFLGRSGSGKTTSFKHALYYLTLAAGSVNKIFTVEKINSINTILEAFGNTKTCLNNNATRFTQILSLDFDHTGMIASASVQLLLLEKSRAGRRTNDHAFHVLSLLVIGAEGLLQKELHIDHLTSENNNPFVFISQKLEEKQRASIEFTRLVQALSILNVDNASVKALWSVLAAIIHLGAAGIARVGTGTNARTQFAHPSAAHKAADLLGITMENLTAAAFPAQSINTNQISASTDVDAHDTAWDSLEALAVGLYSEAVAAVVALINKSICMSVHTIASILLIDSPGFQNPASCGFQRGASLFDLRCNYLQERLQLLFHHTTIVAPQNRYSQELIEINLEGSHEIDPAQLVSLIDKTPQTHVVRTSQRDLREQDRRGLLWLLDEESMYPGSSDDSFLERLFAHYGDREHQYLLRRAPGSRQFVLQHMQGTNSVLYSADGWMRNSREHASTKTATTLLQDSSKTDISRLFIGAITRGTGFVSYGNDAGIDGTHSLRRISSIKRSFTSAGVKKNSVMLQVKFVVDGIVDTLRRTDRHFVHCFLLQHDAGTTSVVTPTGNVVNPYEDLVNIPLLRSQLRGSHILEAARLHRLGFPEVVPLTEFVRRFGLVCDLPKEDLTAEQILTSTDIDPSTYRIGVSQVFLRSAVFGQLEAKREELLSDRIIQFQAVCRGYLMRKKLAQRRVQELAVRCIQRNVKAFLTVRDWPWWRLLVRVTPLLNVHRTEEQLKIANDELLVLRSKLEKIETDRSNLKTENSRLESKLSEMTADLNEERSSSNITSERLEAETAERLRLEKELHQKEDKVRNLQDMSERLEMELICAKSDLNGISDEEDPENEDGGNTSVYRMKYERVAKELEFTKRRLQTQHEHDLEQLVGLKKQLEKKLADAYEEVEEQRQVVGQWKRKNQKLASEMNDLKMLLEEQNGRNNLLEKRQRKFDSECQALQDTARQERQAKDRLSREKDVLIAEKFTLEQSLADARLELDMKDEALASLRREMEEISFGGGTEEEIAQLKRAKLDAEKLCKEQEEELDDMAGQIQLLEQAKLRLEMNLETMRKEARRESQQRDDELEEVRGSTYKKIKALECQLENEHEERTLLLREKHELERRLQMAEEQDRVDRATEEAANQKLKRDLRKYKALHKDAQAQLERLKADSPGKLLIRQLRNQVEDAEADRAIAVKARQTAEAELTDLQCALDEAIRNRNEAENKAVSAVRERSELQIQFEENEEEMAELMKKYTTVVKQLNNEQTIISENEMRISELESERNSLKEQVDELHMRLENVETISDASANIHTKRLELKTKELESRLELEQATRSRIEVQYNRHKDALEKAQQEVAYAKTKEQQAQDNLKKSQKSLRDLREEYHQLANRENDTLAKRKDLEHRFDGAQSEILSLKNDLRLALQRISDLQQAMEEGDDVSSESDDSVSSDESVCESTAYLRARSANSEHQQSNDISPRIKVSSASSTSIATSDGSLNNGETSCA